MIASLIRLVTGAQGRWAGAEPFRADRSVPHRIFFANHCSNLDAPVIWATLPTAVRRITRPVAARDYWERTALRRYLAHRVFNALLIERMKVSRSANPLSAMEGVLAAGGSLILFPEGTRLANEDAGIAPFKPGLWHLARKHPDVELVPVYLENLNRILPKGSLLLMPLLASVTFGKPISLLPGEDKGSFLARTRQAVVDLHPEWHR